MSVVPHGWIGPDFHHGAVRSDTGVIPDPGNSDSFHGIIAVHSGRRGAQRDAVASGKQCNAPDGPL